MEVISLVVLELFPATDGIPVVVSMSKRGEWWS